MEGDATNEDGLLRKGERATTAFIQAEKAQARQRPSSDACRPSSLRAELVGLLGRLTSQSSTSGLGLAERASLPPFQIAKIAG